MNDDPATPAEAPDPVKRVLFVDDEQSVLSGIRRLLHGSHLAWELHFAIGGQAALDQMESALGRITDRFLYIRSTMWRAT
jgi:hypothetical protein